MKSYIYYGALLVFTAQSGWAQQTKGFGRYDLPPAEQAAMEKRLGVKEVRAVHPNALGLKRINDHRRGKGLSLISSSAARTFGKENETAALGSTAPITTDSALAASSLAASLPGLVDNSLLPSFPPIGDQGGEGSCVSFSAGYYATTNNVGLISGYNNKTSSAHRCSPEFLFNRAKPAGWDCGGGSALQHNAEELMIDGCISTDYVPYSSSNGCDAWGGFARDAWANGIQLRLSHFEKITGSMNPSGAAFGPVRQILTNGYVVPINGCPAGTLPDGSVAQGGIGDRTGPLIQSAPGASSAAWAGQHTVEFWSISCPHQITLVGFDDNAWVDLNSNGVVDAGEMGVWRIANSWGTSVGYGGFYNVPYAWIDVPGLPLWDWRTPTMAKNFSFGGQFYHLVPKASGGEYHPILADVSISGAETSMALSFGASSPNDNGPIVSASRMENPGTEGYLFADTTGHYGQVSFAQVLAYGRTVFDLTDFLWRSGNASTNRWYANLSDLSAGNGATVSINQFTITDTATGLSQTTGPVSVADGASRSIAVDLTQSPVRGNPKKCGWNPVIIQVPTTVTVSGMSCTTAPITLRNTNEAECPALSYNFSGDTNLSGAFTLNGSVSVAAASTVQTTVSVCYGWYWNTSKSSPQNGASYVMSVNAFNGNQTSDAQKFNVVYSSGTTVTPTPTPTVSPSPYPSPSPAPKRCRGKKCQ